MTKFLFSTVLCLISANMAYGQISSFDLVDDFFDTEYAGPGSYDIFVADANGGSVGQDGMDDITVSVTTTGVTTDDGNNVAWTATTDASGTGIRSTIDPSFIVGGGVSANNSGYRVSQTIQIDFDGIIIDAADITDFGWSSGNTAGIGWETSLLEYLDENGNPFSTAPTLAPYSDHTPINGQSGIGSFIADSVDTVTLVGTDDTDPGSSGANNNLNTTPSGLGITAGTAIGGVRFTHFLEDVRGIDNNDTGFTATINDLDLVNFTVVGVPEPSSTSLLALVSLLCCVRRNRR